MEAKWYVYQVSVAGYILYIGKGSGRRYLTSAIRCAGIGGIREFFAKEKEAYKREIELIKEFSPPLNKSSGGGGSRRVMPSRDSQAWAAYGRAAYKKADESPSWLNLLFSACYARTELNSRGIKGWPAEEPAQALADPKVDEAIRRLHDWRLYPPPGSLRSTICLA